MGYTIKLLTIAYKGTKMKTHFTCCSRETHSASKARYLHVPKVEWLLIHLEALLWAGE